MSSPTGPGDPFVQSTNEVQDARPGRWSDRFTLIEAGVLLSLSELAIRLLPFRWIAATLLRQDAGDSARREGASAKRNARRVRWAVTCAADRSPFRLECLARALAGRAMLRRRRVPSSLRLGARKGDASGLNAHAWLLVGDVFVTGHEGHETFTEVARFD